ncbi:hypothetical protein TNCV_4070691 [Trichonephila clavipes]|nr:hypothetical protein TNCV_4070691 [Trichonephila clavipes]
MCLTAWLPLGWIDGTTTAAVLFARPGSPMKEGFDLSTFCSQKEYLSHHAKTIIIAWRLFLVYIDITPKHIQLSKIPPHDINE